MSQLEERLSIIHRIGSGSLPPEAGLDQLNMVSERNTKKYSRPQSQLQSRIRESEDAKKSQGGWAVEFHHSRQYIRWWPLVLWMGAGLMAAAAIYLTGNL
jgi:hypothetical protein